MKKALLLATVTLFGISCNKVKQFDTVKKSVTYQEGVTLPTLSRGTLIPPGGVKISMAPYMILTTSEDHLKDINSSPKLVNSVKTVSANGGIVSPAGLQFDFLDSLGVYAYTRKLPAVLIAYKTDFSKTANSDLNSVDRDLTQYFLSDTIFIKVSGTIDSIPPKDTRVDIRTVFELNAKPLN